jgi:hypothetical protein
MDRRGSMTLDTDRESFDNHEERARITPRHISYYRRQPYSVLLLYPDYVGDYGTETFYAFVEAESPSEAIAVARQNAGDACPVVYDPLDFTVLLVTSGHNRDERP